jgi:hypothetical protein
LLLLFVSQTFDDSIKKDADCSPVTIDFCQELNIVLANGRLRLCGQPTFAQQCIAVDVIAYGK